MRPLRNSGRSHRGAVARSLAVAALLAWCAAPAAAQDPAPRQPAAAGLDEPLTLEAAIARATAANPTIAAARLGAAVDAAGLSVAAERPNPEATAEIEKETPRQSFGISVPLELGGKRARRMAVSQAAIRAGAADLEAVIAQVRADVRRGYFETVVAGERLSVLDDARRIAAQAATVSKTRFDDGDIPYLEVLQAELALAAAEAEVLTARGALAASWAKLNALLGQPSDRTRPLTTTADASRAITAASALEQARGRSAELVALDRRIDEQRARVALARAMRVPDVAPGATLTHGAEPEFTYGWRAGLTVTIPLFTTHKAGVTLEDATLAQLQAQRAARLQRVEGDVASAAASAEAQRQAYLRYRDVIVPKAEQVERLALESFQSGQTGLPALLLAFQATRDVRLRSLDAVGQFQSAVADLERAVGAPLP